MEKIIEIMDYKDDKKKVKIDNFEDVVRLEIEVISGDELLYILYKDYSVMKYDSSDCRRLEYNDSFYCIYDITKDIDYLERWNERIDSYNFKKEE